MSIVSRAQRRGLRAHEGPGLWSLLLPALLIGLWIVEFSVTAALVFRPRMGQDFSTMYCAALAWLHGASPYFSAAPRLLAARLHLPFIYVADTPATLLLYVPFTLLAARNGVLAFAAASCMAALLAGYLMTAGLAHAVRRTVALGLLASPALFLTYYTGQSGAFLALAVAAALWARLSGRDALAGALVATACAIKPQLGLCVALPLLWGRPRRAWVSAAIGGAAWLALSVLILTPAGVLPYLARLRWFGGHAVAYDAYDGLGLASLYVSWLPPHLRPLVALGVTLVLVGAVITLVWRVRWRPRPRHIVAASVLATLALPYSHHYDLIALAPAVALAWRAAYKAMARTALCAATALLVLAPLLSLDAPDTPIRLAPLGLLLVLSSLNA